MAAACLCGGPARVPAEVVVENPMVEFNHMRDLARRAALRTNVDPVVGDTVWVGHVYGTHSVPWSANPAWSGSGPFHVGRGGYRVTGGAPSASNNGYWDFDRLNPGEADTLQGWNSVAMPFHKLYDGSDREYRWFNCLDFGNGGNHRGTGGTQTYGVTGYWHVDAGANAFAPAIANTSPVHPAAAQSVAMVAVFGPATTRPP